MPATGFFSPKKVASLLDRPVTQEVIDHEESDLVRRLLERHQLVEKLSPALLQFPFLPSPVDELKSLDLHQTLHVEDLFVKSAALAASLRALSIESAGLAARLYGLKLEIDELERQKQGLERYIGEPQPDAHNPHAEPLADAMVQDAVRSKNYSTSEIAHMRLRVSQLRTQALLWHHITPGHAGKTIADFSVQLQRTINFLRVYLIALLYAYRQVYNGKASPAVTGEWGQLLQQGSFLTMSMTCTYC